ncbi:autotransporter domain-containing protein [Phreatobacter sp.]|uniref:autotransporter outer membrane beta-barrel domain-containing protein n=1 Tax=Phreatobacter sp. TaxID=1966341 RepID=UPI0022C0A4DD|nr:autotransporter domain-containing protein [Phreatobacter sp.]MCZ8317033.1 autotransporter domain-containing protein [Phreatobacter sp.]
MVFYDQSTAGSANLDNSGTLNFVDSSTAGSATITNRQGGATTFSGTSKAGSAAITNTGDLIFIDSATADASTITNAGRTSFEGGSSAAASNITNQSGGTLAFYNTSTAGTATITNQTGGYAGFAGYSTAGSATIVNNGAFLFLNFASAASATITNNGGMAFGEGSTADHATITNNDFLEFSGISTAGSATITGNGTLRFIQDSTTGNASITTGGMVQLATNDTTGAATVTIQSGGILSGFGSVGNTTIQSGGTIAASGGTLQINGNLTLGPGSLYGVCTCAMTAVTGTATLGGAALVLPPSLAQPSFQGGQSYTVLTATGGVNGTFGTVNSPLVSVLYGTNDVSITIAAYTTGAALGGTGGTNARNVGGALDRVIVASAGAPPTSLNPLLGLFGAPLANAMNGLSGEAATGAQASAFTSASTFLGIMLDPMAGARGATAAAPGSSLIQMADTGRTPAARVTAGWSVWTKSFGQAGRTASDAATGAAGTASSLYGVAAGADRLISPDTLIGFALAGGGTAYGLGTRGTGSGDFAQLGLYGSTRLGPGYVSAALAYGWNRFDVSRTAGLGPTETYRSAPTVHTFGGRIEAGRRFGDRAFAATPYAALEVIGASTAGYRESWGPGNTGAFALAYGARTYANARAEAGMRLDSLRAVAPTADLLTFARLAYGFQAGTQRSAEASFQQLANSGFTVFGARASTHTALGSLGLELRLATGTRVTASLDGELGDRHRSLRANAGISHSW